jgi:hypothetical protein
MAKIYKGPDLIKIASESGISEGNPVRFNYRAKIYSVVLVCLLVALTSLIATRTKFDATVLRVPGQILQENKDGTVSNLYRIKVVSKSMKTEPYHLIIDDKDARIVYVGKHLDSLHSGVMAEETFFIKVPARNVSGRKQKYSLQLMSAGDKIQSKEVTFISEY